MALGWSLRSIAVPKGALLVPVAIGCVYLWLAVRYWFRVPAIGIAAATACLAAAWVVY